MATCHPHFYLAVGHSGLGTPFPFRHGPIIARVHRDRNAPRRRASHPPPVPALRPRPRNWSVTRPGCHRNPGATPTCAKLVGHLLLLVKVLPLSSPEVGHFPEQRLRALYRICCVTGKGDNNAPAPSTQTGPQTRKASGLAGGLMSQKACMSGCPGHAARLEIPGHDVKLKNWGFQSVPPTTDVPTCLQKTNPRPARMQRHQVGATVIFLWKHKCWTITPGLTVFGTPTRGGPEPAVPWRA